MRWLRRSKGDEQDTSAEARSVDESVRVLPRDGLPTDTASDAALEELQRSFARTVVIEDDDRPSTVVIGDDSNSIPVATSSPTMDPRIRERRIAVRRSEGRKRLRWVAIVVAVVVVVVGVLVVLASPLLSIRDVDVDGAVYVSRFDRELLDEVVDDLRGEPILIADLRGAEQRLEQSPWVRSARVSMRFPDAVRIELRERVPQAWYAAADGQHRVIDDDGRVIVVLGGQPVDYVQITGAGPEVGPGGYAGAAYRAAAQVVRALPPELRPQVASLGVTDDGELTMELVAGTDVRLGLPDDLQSKLVSVVVVLRRQDAESLTLIDVSSGEPTIR